MKQMTNEQIERSYSKDGFSMQYCDPKKIFLHIPGQEIKSKIENTNKLKFIMKKEEILKAKAQIDKLLFTKENVKNIILSNNLDVHNVDVKKFLQVTNLLELKGDFNLSVVCKTIYKTADVKKVLHDKVMSIQNKVGKELSIMLNEATSLVLAKKVSQIANVSYHTFKNSYVIRHQKWERIADFLELVEKINKL